MAPMKGGHERATAVLGTNSSDESKNLARCGKAKNLGWSDLTGERKEVLDHRQRLFDPLHTRLFLTPEQMKQKAA